MKKYLLMISLIMTVSWLSADNEEKPKVEVLFFVATDCPIANHYAPEISRIWAEFNDQGVEFSLIYPNTKLTDKQVADHRREYGLKISGIIDHDHTFVKKAGATTTPEVAVFNSDGKLVYRGMIDDLYTELGDRRRVASKRYLRDVLPLCLKNKAVLFSETAAVGCLIESIK